MSLTLVRGKTFLRSMTVLAAGTVAGLVVVSVASSGTVAGAIRDVQGVPVKLCSEGDNVYGSDFEWMFSAEGEPLFEFSTNPDQLVMLDGTKIDRVEKIPGTNSFREPNAADPTRADVVYEVLEIRPGEFAVSSVLACDYDTLKDRTGYQP